MLRHLIKSFRNQLVLSTVETLLQRRNTGLAPKESASVDVIHSLPGRVRLRSGIIINQQPIAESLQDTLNMVEGIAAAVVDWRTGSVLIEYENGMLHSSQLKAAVERLLEDEQESPTGNNSAGTAVLQRPSAESIFAMVTAQPLLYGSLALLLLAGLLAESRKSAEVDKRKNE